MSAKKFESIIATLVPEQLLFFEALVRENSFSDNVDGVNRVQTMLERECQALGLGVSRHVGVGCGDLLTASTAARGAPMVTLIHADTVHPPESPFCGFSIAEGRARGPGVLDMKGGIVVLFTALKALQTVGLLAAVPLKIIANPAEESGSVWARSVMRNELRGARAALVFEWGRDGDRLITRRKGIYTGRIRVTGRAAHAGNAHRDGVNAITVLARLVSAIAALTDYRVGLTANVGRISGGVSVNTVPERASADFELRAIDAGSLQDAQGRVATFVAAAGQEPGTAVVLEEVSAIAPMTELPQTVALVTSFTEAAQRAGLTLGGVTDIVGGISDANCASSVGVPTIDGLGPRGEGAHTDQEYCEINSIWPRAIAVAEWLAGAVASAKVE